MATAAPTDLDAALASAEFAHGERQGFWHLVERRGEVLYVEVFAYDGVTYVLELQCDRYGFEPIRGRFVNSKTFTCQTEAWPRGDGTFGGWFKWDAANLFICWPGDRGGVEHHAEWRPLQHWRKTKNQLVQYLEFIRQSLTLPARGYRSCAQSITC